MDNSHSHPARYSGNAHAGTLTHSGRLTQGKWQDVSELITLYSKYETTADGREEKHHSTVSLKVCLWVVFLCDVSHHFLSLPPHSSSSGSVACLLSKCRKHACTSITCNTVLFRLINHDRFHGWLVEASFNKALNYWKTDLNVCFELAYNLTCNTVSEKLRVFISSGELYHLYTHHSHPGVQTEGQSDEIYGLQNQVRHVDVAVVLKLFREAHHCNY